MTKRLFIAIDISDEARRKVAEYLQSLSEDFPNLQVGWEMIEKLHLTLKFLGEVNVKTITAIEDIVKNTAQNFREFSIKLSKTGVFPNSKRVSILWLGIEDESENLSNIFQFLEEALSKSGFPKENRKFRPHLTLARLRESENAQKLMEKHLTKIFEPVEFEVTELVIYESQLQSTGSVYRKLKKIKLKQ